MTIETIFPLGWMHYLAGGLLIGAGVSVLFVTTGLIGGMSSFFSSTLSYISRHRYFHQSQFIESRRWRLVYALGLVLGAALWFLASGDALVITRVNIWQLVLGGFIAGFGARLSGGCTSGHGICGMASLQLPSILAVIIFLATGMLTAHLVRLVGGV
jgi:uncharacterized membrane protein YedE/YeeE